MAGVARDASGPASPKPGVAPQRNLRVYISSSRDDLDFADQLDAALNAYGFECLVDRHDISGGEDWKGRLVNLISAADAVVLVLSPSSARSEICSWEVEEAIRLGKRIFPVNCRPLEGVSPPPRLRELNYIFFYADPKVPGSGFGIGLARLITALNIDLDWLREHTRLLQRATEWDRGGRPANRLLLSGDDIADARAWAARRPKDAPEPMALHLDFIRASEERAEKQPSLPPKELGTQKRWTFVSFSHNDRGAATEIVRELELANIRCWISTRDVPFGEDYQGAIVDALDQADSMVLIVSKNANNSTEVAKELALASEYKFLILPVRIEDAKPTKALRYQLATRQYIDLFDDQERKMKLIIQALNKISQERHRPS